MKRDRPWMPFYTADWLSNVKLKRCTHEEKGVWMDILCLMHESEEYGVLRWDLKEIAHVVGCAVKTLKSLISKGVLKGAEPAEICPALQFTPTHARKRLPAVTIIESQAGPIWYSSRMVEDEYKRIVKQGTNATSGAAPKTPPDLAPKPPFGEGFGDSPYPPPDPSPPTRARETEDRGHIKTKDIGGGASDSTVGDPVDNSASPPPLSADEIGNHLVQLEAERGKSVALSSRAREALLRLADRNIAMPVLLRAHALACARRTADQDPGPVHPGFLEPFVDEALAELRTAPPAPGWDETPEGVQAKADELQLAPQRADEHPIWFRRRVIKASGDQHLVEREVNKAERMNPNEFEVVYRFFHGVTPGQVAA